MPSITIVGSMRHPESVSINLRVANENIEIFRSFEFRDGDAITFRNLKDYARAEFDKEQARLAELKRQERLLNKRHNALQGFMNQDIDSIANQVFEDAVAAQP